MTNRRAFNDLALRELLPAFCDYYGYSVAGFRRQTLDRITEHDASWFLEALKAAVVAPKQAFFVSALSGAKEQIFWQAGKAVLPRPITLWMEPVITISAAGRLHLQFGWPRHLIGLQSKRSWAFDLVAYSEDQQPLVACEIKKTRREVDDLVKAMVQYLSQLPLSEEPSQQKLRNAYRKVVGLREMRPAIFWALGPDSYGKVFRLFLDATKVFGKLEEVGEDALRYPASASV